MLLGQPFTGFPGDRHDPISQTCKPQPGRATMEPSSGRSGWSQSQVRAEPLQRQHGAGIFNPCEYGVRHGLCFRPLFARYEACRRAECEDKSAWRGFPSRQQTTDLTVCEPRLRQQCPRDLSVIQRNRAVQGWQLALCGEQTSRWPSCSKSEAAIRFGATAGAMGSWWLPQDAAWRRELCTLLRGSKVPEYGVARFDRAVHNFSNPEAIADPWARATVERDPKTLMSSRAPTADIRCVVRISTQPCQSRPSALDVHRLFDPAVPSVRSSRR